MSELLPAKLIQLATSYQRSRVLFALVELGLPTWLASGSRPLGDIAARLGAEPLAIDRFLCACVGLGLLARDGDGYSNSPETHRYLVCGAPEYLGDLIRRYDAESSSESWAQLAHRLGSWRPGERNDHLLAERDACDVEIRGHHQLSLQAGEALGRAVDFSGARCLLDLGGGTGAMAIALCRRYPTLRAIVVDRPPIVPIARAYARESDLEHRIQVVEGDIASEPLPAGCDVVLLANVLSLMDAATNRSLMKRIFRQLPAGGVLLLTGWMLGDDRVRPEPLLPLLFCLEDVVLGAPDLERPAATYAEWLAEAGFEDIQHSIYFDPATLLIGRKPHAAPRPQSDEVMSR